MRFLQLLLCTTECAGPCDPASGDASGASPLAAAARGVSGETDRENEARALKNWFDVEPPTKLLESGYTDRENEDRDDRSESIHAPGPDSRGPEQRANEGWQQELWTDGALADPQARRQNDASKSSNGAADYEYADD